MAVPGELHALIERFDRDLPSYRSAGFNEAQARIDFINPLLGLLGWDVENRRGLPETYREVVYEDRVKVGGGTKAPDYGFYAGGQRRFFLEAKKPSVDIAGDVAPAVQLRRYAWSARLPLSILTDFEEFAVYDCRFEPQKEDDPATARTELFTYDRYAEEEVWERISSVFSREAVLSGSLEKYAEQNRRRRGTETVDSAFLREIEGWRDSLARDLATRNGLNGRQLNYAVQMTIDRIIFLRMAEDRGIEGYGRLLAAVNGDGVYGRLRERFREADDRYNSGLFHFRDERGRGEDPDTLTLSLEVGDGVLRGIIRGLYYPESPYEFSVLPVDVLGQVYEQFLGKVIRLEDGGHKAVVEEKPEVRKAGGVYYTPTYIVEKTVGKLLEGKRPGPRGGASKLKIVDPACGSGSFLIGAYQYLLDWHRDRYLEDGPGKHPKQLYQGYGGQWHLTIDEKKRILLNNIHGVDIDPQAVEVTKLSLVLKVLEGESEASLATQLRMFQERALPDLDNNIKCGNSLIGPDFYESEQMMLLDDEEHYRINVFDWEKSFPQVFSGDNPGFDAVIGNPPYGADYTAFEKRYFQSHYVYKKGKPETYIYFLEQGIALLSNSGMLGYITPNAWLTNYYGVQLRRHVFANCLLQHLVDLEPTKVFQQAVVDTAITILSKAALSKAAQTTKVWRGTRDHQIVCQFDLHQELWESDDEAVINLQAKPEELELLARLARESEALASLVEYSQGVIPYKTKAEGNKNLYIAEEKRENGWIPLIEKASQVRRYEIDKPTAFIHFGPWLWCPRDPRFFSQPKILFHRLRKKLPKQLVGAFDDSGVVNRHSLSNLVLRPGIPTSTLLAVLGLFNSNFANWWFVKRYGLLMEVGGFKVARLPLPEHWDRGHYQLVALVERMLELHERLAEARIERERTVIGARISATDRRIDRLVYELYVLTDDEIRVVEEAMTR